MSNFYEELLAENNIEGLVGLAKLNKDLRVAAAALGNGQPRFIVDLYYQVQELRKGLDNQCRALSTNGEPIDLLTHFANAFRNIEKSIKGALQKYVEAQPIGKWMMSITGIGPVIAAGLIANVDIKKVQTAGQIHAYCGLDPTKTWEKGKKRPWNAQLKRLCFLIGESFVKVSNNENDVYGKIYRKRKEYELEKNENGDYAEYAAQIIATKHIGKDTEAYKAYSAGKLPLGHINNRAKRYAVKMFLSHMFQVWYELDRGEAPPKPFAIAILNHAHEVPVPNWR